MLQGSQGSKQHLALAAPATLARTQQPRKYLAVHAAELAVEPNFQILRRHRRSLLLRLEHAHRSAVENHVHRAPRLGSRRSPNLRIGINPISAMSRPSASALATIASSRQASDEFFDVVAHYPCELAADRKAQPRPA